jgi:hypothetical protein
VHNIGLLLAGQTDASGNGNHHHRSDAPYNSAKLHICQASRAVSAPVIRRLSRGRTQGDNRGECLRGLSNGRLGNDLGHDMARMDADDVCRKYHGRGMEL